MWKPSTVEDIRQWMAGSYVPNPSPEEYRALWLAKIRAWKADGKMPRVRRGSAGE